MELNRNRVAVLIQFYFYICLWFFFYQVGSLFMGKCNLHSMTIGDGLSATIHQIEIRQFISQSDQLNASWLEACSVFFPALQFDLADLLQSSNSYKAQNFFLSQHDKKTQRLWFLWPEESDESVDHPRNMCGCRGGCLFFNTHSVNAQSNWISDSSWKTSVTDVDNDYGHSILQKGQWIFAVCDRTPVDSPTREFKFTQGFVSTTVPILPGQVAAADLLVRASGMGGSSVSLPQPIEQPQKADSSSLSVPESREQPSRNASLSTSSVQASTNSDPTLTIKTESDSSIFERHLFTLHGSSHSLPVEAMALQSKMTSGRSNVSAEMIRQIHEVSDSPQSPHSLTLVRSEDIPDLPHIGNSHGSISSPAESEYYSAEDETPLSATMSKILVETPSSTSFDTNIPSISPTSVYADETLSSVSTQQVESPEYPRPDEEDGKRHSSSASYVSAASSESSLHPRKKPKEAPPQIPTTQPPWASTKAYCHHLTLWECNGWVTHPPGHALQVHPPFSPLCAPATTLIKGNIPLPEFTITQAGLRSGLVRMTDCPRDETGADSEDEEDDDDDDDSADSEMHLGLPHQDVRRHTRVHSSPPSYQVTQSKSNKAMSTQTNISCYPGDRKTSILFETNSQPQRIIVSF